MNTCECLPQESDERRSQPGPLLFVALQLRFRKPHLVRCTYTPPEMRRRHYSPSTSLASLASVDAVVIFPEQTPLKLIKALKPDVLIKGADYNIDSVVGADVVRKYGGTVKLAKLEPGHSTSATIAKMGRKPKKKPGS